MTLVMQSVEIPKPQVMKFIVGMMVGFALGLLLHLVMASQSGADYHWQKVRNYNSFVNDPSNYKPDTRSSFSVTTPPTAPLQSLAALVEAGELSHVDLVLPGVLCNREATGQWMRFAQAHKEIIYIVGNPTYEAFKPKGDQPLHLNIWFRDTDQPVILALIRELEGATNHF